MLVGAITGGLCVFAMLSRSIARTFTSSILFERSLVGLVRLAYPGTSFALITRVTNTLGMLAVPGCGVIRPLCIAQMAAGGTLLLFGLSFAYARVAGFKPVDLSWAQSTTGGELAHGGHAGIDVSPAIKRQLLVPP